MKFNWRRLITIDKQRLLLCGTCLILSGFAFLFLDFTKPKIKSKEDLIFIKGPFLNYSWINLSKGSSLTFHLKNYNDNFKIKADFFTILKQDDFKNIPNGEIIELGIPLNYKKYLNTNKDLFFVYSITSRNNSFLDYKDSIKKHNSSFIKIAFGIFILLGVICLYFGFKRGRKH